MFFFIYFTSNSILHKNKGTIYFSLLLLDTAFHKGAPWDRSHKTYEFMIIAAAHLSNAFFRVENKDLFLFFCNAMPVTINRIKQTGIYH